MATTFTTENVTEALILEQALAYARQLQRTAVEAPDGQVLRSAEAFVLEQGRDLLRRSLEITLQGVRPANRVGGRSGAMGGIVAKSMCRTGSARGAFVRRP